MRRSQSSHSSSLQRGIRGADPLGFSLSTLYPESLSPGRSVSSLRPGAATLAPAEAREPGSNVGGSRRLLAVRSHRLRHDDEREIVAVAAAVAGLEVVAAHIQDRAIGKIFEGASNGRRRGVGDDR